ncbi:flavodoxin [Methanobrevibacter sp.]|uniref:flavodoxin family protein n=1 Tax=Methanobrevibacter sp. TaxID=66852 RepID=UPI0025EDF3CE|nr:flavodoxin [Methanobrevibacter sp.]MBQ2962383.1 flavodoxin [Methanobrevibacter sp.]
MSVLVAYYSRSNVTKKLAEAIARETGADIEEIVSKVNYDGKIGYMRGGKDAISEKIIDLEALEFDPSDYDLVYLGVPVWAGKAANPMISYIKQNEGKFNDVKFFVTAGGSGFEGTFAQMEKYVGKAPLKTLALTTKEVKRDEFSEELSSFIE